MKGGDTNVVLSDGPSRWEPGQVLGIGVVILMVLVATVSCSTMSADEMGSDIDDGDRSSTIEECSG